jgi:hypothetical protein
VQSRAENRMLQAASPFPRVSCGPWLVKSALSRLGNIAWFSPHLIEDCNEDIRYLLPTAVSGLTETYMNFWCLFQGYNIKASCNLMMRNHSVWSVWSAPKEVQQLPNITGVGFQVAANAEETLDIRIEVDKIRTMLPPLLSSCRMSWWANSVF